jgi:hypothetical protein
LLVLGGGLGFLRFGGFLGSREGLNEVLYRTGKLWVCGEVVCFVGGDSYLKEACFGPRYFAFRKLFM